MISGNLWTMGLPEILQWISTGRKTGTLEIERDPVLKKILFRDGAIRSSWSNDPREHLGQFLIRTRKVTEDQLFKSLSKSEEEKRLLGEILIESDYLTEEDLRASLKAKAEETIYDLFLWEEARFEFKDGEFPAELTVVIEMPVTAVILEGIRRVDEWKRIKEALPSLHSTFKLKGAGAVEHNEDERHMLGLVASGKSLAQIALEMRRSGFDAAELLYSLYARELVEVDEIREDPFADIVNRTRELLANAEEHLSNRMWDSALVAYEAVLEMDRLNQHAKKGLIATIERRSRDRSLRSVALDKVPHLAVDYADLTKQNFDAQEGFVLSRVNGEWDVHSILKLCPMGEDEVLLIFARLIERGVIDLKEA